MRGGGNIVLKSTARPSLVLNLKVNIYMKFIRMKQKYNGT